MRQFTKAEARRNRIVLFAILAILVIAVVFVVSLGRQTDKAKKKPAQTQVTSQDTDDLPEIALRVGQELTLDEEIYGNSEWESSDENIVVVGSAGKMIGLAVGNCEISTESNGITKTVPVTVVSGYMTPEGGEPQIRVVDGVTYVNGILIVNKTYSLPEDYNYGADEEALAALYDMFDAAEEDGIELFIASGFRSYEDQKVLYEKYEEESGKEAADTYSARAGYSEHQSGLAFDVNDPSDAFNDTSEAQWLAEHCAEFGFIIRFPKGKESETGYQYESWHVRYLGVEAAKEVTESGKSLEAFLGITSEYQD